MATEGHELDLATQSVTKLTTIARFAAALGKVLERPDIGAKLADGCAAKGVVNVGALRGLGYDAQLELYSTCGLGNLFNNTINQFLGYAGEEQYTPQAPAPMGALGGGDGATPKSSKAQPLSFPELAPNIPPGFDCKRDIEHLPGMVLDQLPKGQGRPILKVGLLVRAIKDWLFVRFACVHSSHPGTPVPVEDIIRRVAELITDPEARGHDIYEGSPSVHYAGAAAVELLLGKVKSKLTQDRQNVRQFLDPKFPGTDRARLCRALSPADAARVKDVLDAGFGHQYPTAQGAADLETKTVGAGGLVADEDNGIDGAADQQCTGLLEAAGEAEGEATQLGSGGFGAPPLPGVVQQRAPIANFVPTKDAAAPTAAHAATAAAAAVNSAAERGAAAKAKAQKKAQTAKKKLERQANQSAATKENAAQPTAVPPASKKARREEARVLGLTWAERLKSIPQIAAKYDEISKEEVQQLSRLKADMMKHEGYGGKDVRVAALFPCVPAEAAAAARDAADLFGEEDDEEDIPATLPDFPDALTLTLTLPLPLPQPLPLPLNLNLTLARDAEWFVGYFCHLIKQCPKTESKGTSAKDRFWVAFSDAKNGMKLKLDLDYYNTNVPLNAWVLLRAKDPSLLEFD